MEKLVKLFLLISAAYFVCAEEIHHVKLHFSSSTQNCLIIESSPLRKFRGFETDSDSELLIKASPAVKTAPDSPTSKATESDDKIIEIFSRRKDILDSHVEIMCRNVESMSEFTIKQADDIEVVEIIDGGDQGNRIDVVFMGDGYTATERDQFFSDIRRLTEDMFNGVTFRSYLPLFNIWAIYVPSAESGIGYDGPKNTPFRLYRQAGQLRGIYPGNASYAREVCRLTGAGGCDYPSLIGNDDYYGGLGGEFVISTKSNRTGTVVLRHEMGHNFVDVGEEYDNGGVYRGVNSAPSVASLGWGHWLSSQEAPVAERAIYRILEYPWADLWAEGAQHFNFTSDGQYSRWYLSISVSAAGEEDSLEFLLDGEILPWSTHGFDDREFFDWYGDEGFSSGEHTFSVRTKTEPTNPSIPRMICSVRLHEFGAEGEFHVDNGWVGAYPTWNNFGGVVYRPTNAGCLMRNMTHNEFCPVCQEGMWYQFLERISLIDSVTISGLPDPDGTKRVTLSTLKLGQLRSQSETQIAGEQLQVTWTLGGEEQPEFQDLFEISAARGNWSVQVTFITPEVRADPKGLLVEKEDFIVT